MFTLPTRVVPAALSLRVLPADHSLAWPPVLTLLGFAGLTAALAQEHPPIHCAPAAPADADQPSGYVVDPAMRKKYGRYLPWQRLNVDQVPLPFVNDMETTYEERGALRVTINQGGPSLGKRQATGQVCFRPMVPPPTGCTDAEARQLYHEHLQAQPAPCIIFRGQGNITDFEREGYPEGLVVLWQAKAWVDRPIAREWVEDVIQPFMRAERRAGVASSNTRYLLFQDNLDSQKQCQLCAATPERSSLEALKKPWESSASCLGNLKKPWEAQRFLFS